MLFGTDKQTIADLDIFPQEKNTFSVFDYYNRLQTYGGKRALQWVMNNPLNDRAEIDARLSVIRFLHDHEIFYKLDKYTLDAIDFYLTHDNIPVLKDNILDSSVDYISNALKPSNNYYLICRGIQSLIDHLTGMRAFFDRYRPLGFPAFLEEFGTVTATINALPDFRHLITAPREKLTFRQISRFDRLIRVQEKELIVRLLDMTYLFDVYLSTALVASKKKLCFPVLTDSPEPELSLEGFFHPFLDNPVKNDITMSGHHNLCFVTGANMSGKSTFLKAVGLCVYLSHIGFPVPAAKMTVSVFNGLYSTVNIADNINKGYSHYYGEVKRVKEIMMQIKERKRVFVVFDELFRGTNVKDAFDATLMIISGFCGIRQSMFFISTHIVETGSELSELSSICFKRFISKLDKDLPVYDYKIHDGISAERYGLIILKNEGIDAIINEIAGEDCEAADMPQ
jgi:DNA mismatch repair ATPase MutS